MFLEILIAICIGVGCGIVTGLTPGIHINLISTLLLSLSAVLLGHVGVLSLVCFVIAMSVTHTFLDTIPSTFLGAPDDSTALGVLPGHRYLLQGYGYSAVRLTLIGSFGGLLLSVLLFPLLVPVVGRLYPLIKDYIGYILILVALFMILRDRKKMWSLIVFMFSGCLGLIVLNNNFDNPLFPMFSGLFGISTLLISLNSSEKIPEQLEKQELKVRKGNALKALLSGQFSGFITAVFPGLGAATAAVLSMQITRKLGDQGFMILIGSISTVNFVLSLVTYFVLDKARNGSIIAVQQLMESISVPVLMVYLCTALIAGSIAVFLGLKISKVFSDFIGKVNYKMLVIGVIVLIVVLVAFLTRWKGLLILLISTCIGLIPAIVKTSRTHAMGCLLVPVIFFLIA